MLKTIFFKLLFLALVFTKSEAVASDLQSGCSV